MFEDMDFAFDSASSEIPSGPYLPEAGDCVRCGVCLSVCPTYHLHNEEQQGPRARVNSLRRLLQQQQTLTVDERQQLQSCVQCRACESVCPSRMDYASFFDRANAQICSVKPVSAWARLGLFLIAHKSLFNALLPLVRLYQASGLRRLSKKFAIPAKLGLEHAERLVEKPVLSALRSHYPVLYPCGSVALFSGCVSNPFDRQTLLDAITLLNRIGFDVLVPERQACCGAIHYHNGRQREGLDLMRRNASLFERLPVRAIVYCATGCGSQLQDYPQLLGMDEDATARYDDRLFEISEFVARHWPDDLSLSETQARIRVHEPCSQRNVLQTQAAMWRLLQKIPANDIEALPDNPLCCGAGGSYLLTHPENAAALASLKWRLLRQSKPDILLTSNYGCELHLKHAREASERVEILHPVSLIVRLLEAK